METAMALAHLVQEEGGPGKRRFSAELGSNRFWRIAVGDDQRRKDQGLDILANPSWVSPMSGPLPPEKLGRVAIEVDEEKFDRTNRYLQMMTYRDSEQNGPAVSDILETRPSLPAPADLLGKPAPVRAYALTAPRHPGEPCAPGRHAMRWQIAPRSQAMFLPAFLAPLIAAAGPVLSNALPMLASAVAPLAGNLINSLLGGGGKESGGSGKPAAGSSPGGLDTDALVKLIGELQKLAAPAATPTTKSLGRAASARAVRAMTARHRRARTRSANRYRTQAMAVPVALLTQLMPLLQKVLTPETVQAIINMPNKHMETVFNAAKEAAKLGIESHEQELEHLRKLNPGVNDPAFDQMINELSLGLARPHPGQAWRRVETVELVLDSIATVSLAGRLTALYAADRPIAFPLSVKLPLDAKGQGPKLAAAKLQLQIKDQATLAVLYHQEWDVGAVEKSGPLPLAASVAPSALAGLPRGKDLIFCFALIWPNRKGEARGAPLLHLAQLAEGLVFDRIEERGAPLTLEDPGKYGDYRHDIWSNRFRSDSRRVVGELVYVAALGKPEARQHLRLAADVQSRGAVRVPTRREVRIHSGLEFAIDELIRLGSLIDPAAPPLDNRMRAAITASAFSEYFNRSTRIEFDFRGRNDQTFVMRGIPVVDLARLHFLEIDQVDEHGQVRSLRPVEAQLPVPVALSVTVEPLAGSDRPDKRLFAAVGQLAPARLVAVEKEVRKAA
jgi:hypothetical protein